MPFVVSLKFPDLVSDCYPSLRVTGSVGAGVPLGAGSGSGNGVGVAEGLEPGDGLGSGVGVWNVLSLRFREESPAIPEENANNPIAPETTKAPIKIPNLFFISYLFLSGWIAEQDAQHSSPLINALTCRFRRLSRAHTYIDCERPITVQAKTFVRTSARLQMYPATRVPLHLTHLPLPRTQTVRTLRQ